MITLHTFGPGFGLPDPSPFCMKAMSLLKLADLTFETADGDPRKAPKGKIPWMIDEGVAVPDTTFIQFHIEKKYGVDFHAGLDARQRAIAWSFEKLCEDHLYFCILHERWMIDANFNKGPKKFFDAVPAIMRPIVSAMVRRDIRKSLHGHGMGRHSHAEISELARRDIQALADHLGDNSYFMGDRMTGADAAVHPFVASVLCAVFDGPTLEAARSHKNLVAYNERLLKAWYADFAQDA